LRYVFISLFISSEEQKAPIFQSEAKVGVRDNDSAFKVEVKPFLGYHPSVYGIKVFLRKHGILPPAGFSSESRTY